jgi:hypothetical protein
MGVFITVWRSGQHVQNGEGHFILPSEHIPILNSGLLEMPSLTLLFVEPTSYFVTASSPPSQT